LSAISFMRECISEHMNPSPLFIIRNNFPFTLSLFLFSVIINFENTKTFPLLHFTNQNTTSISFTVYHCIAYYFSLHISAAYDFWRRCICIFIYIAYLLSSFVYLHTPCAWQPLGEVEGTKQIYLPCRLLEEGQEGPCTHSSPRVRYKPSSHLRGGNSSFPMLSTLHLESQPSKASRRFSGTVAEELVEPWSNNYSRSLLQDLWMWHYFFGLPGSLNDINVLQRSHIFSRLFSDNATACNYTVNGHEYNMGY
jgi:hypothetical protein